MLNPNVVAKKIGIPVERWKGNCYAIACKIIEHGIVEGRAVHGTYFGTISQTGYFKGQSIARHGWIEKSDGTIVDPTLWVFLDVCPFIHEGPLNKDFYDEGSSKLRLMTLSPQPEYSTSDRQLTLPDDTTQSAAIKQILNVDRDVISLPEAFWVANLPLDDLKELAKTVYQALIKMNFKGFIPTDHYIKVFNLKSVSEV